MNRSLVQLNAAKATGTAVLALHSLGLNGSSWQGVADAARTEHPFYVFDQRAHGTQAATVPVDFDAFVEDAAHVLRELTAERVHLVGHSLGGAVIACLAAQSANMRIASLSVVATPLTGLPTFWERAHAVADGDMVQVCAETLDRWFDADAPDSAIKAAKAALFAMQPEGFDACWTALAAFTGYADLHQRAIPLQVISFANDRSTPPELGAQLAATLQPVFDVRGHHIIAGAGHMGVLTHPADLAPLLTAHWRACETAQVAGGLA